MADLDCPICLQQLNGVVIKMNCCKLDIHKACMDRWLNNNDSCPNCRANVVKYTNICPKNILIISQFLKENILIISKKIN